MLAYVTVQGAKLTAVSERLIVSYQGEKIGEIETVRCDGVLLHGLIEITTPAIALCARKKIPVSFLTQSGNKLKARLVPAGIQNRYRRQYELLACEQTVLALAKSAISRKLEGQSYVLNTYASNIQPVPKKISDSREKLKEMKQKVMNAVSANELFGLEGIAAREYFSAWPDILIDTPWPGRTGRNASDPVNAMLNLAYTLLTTEITARLDAVGLDPETGFLHSDRAARPSLALDLMEPLRPGLCDRFVLTMFNRKEIDIKSDYEDTPNGLRLKPGAFRKSLCKWEERQNAPMPGRTDGITGDGAIAEAIDSFLKSVLKCPGRYPRKPQKGSE